MRRRDPVGSLITASIEYMLHRDIEHRISLQIDHAIAMGKLRIKTEGTFSKIPRGIEYTPHALTYISIAESLVGMKGDLPNAFSCCVVRYWPVKIADVGEFCRQADKSRAWFYQNCEMACEYIRQHVDLREVA